MVFATDDHGPAVAPLPAGGATAPIDLGEDPTTGLDEYVALRLTPLERDVLLAYYSAFTLLPRPDSLEPRSHDEAARRLGRSKDSTRKAIERVNDKVAQLDGPRLRSPPAGTSRRSSAAGWPGPASSTPTERWPEPSAPPRSGRSARRQPDDELHAGRPVDPLGGHRAAHGLNKLAHDGQPQPGPARPADRSSHGPVGGVGAVEHVGEVGRTMPGPSSATTIRLPPDGSTRVATQMFPPA